MKSGREWRTDKCGRCGYPHISYSGKIDKNGVEYVVCGVTNKRMNVSGTGKEGNSWAYPTIWVDDSRRGSVYCPYCQSFVCVCDEESSRR